MISVFAKGTKKEDMVDEQGDVKRNGDCVLNPTSCTCVRELCGEFSLSLEIENPDERTFDFLRPWNIISAPILGRWWGAPVAKKQQLFVIVSSDNQEKNDGTVTCRVYAQQIAYVLTLLKTSASIWNDADYGGKRQNEIKWLLDYFCGNVQNDSLYKFNVYTNWGGTTLFKLGSDVTGLSALIGDSSLSSHLGGEISRDNFRINFMQRKRYAVGDAVNPAFRFISGKEIYSITESIDYNDTVTKLFVLQNEEKSIKHVLTVPYERLGLPAHSEGYYTSSKETDAEVLADAERYFDTVNHPKISYTMTLNDMHHMTEYKDFENSTSPLLDVDIGDVGYVYSPRLKINVLQKVTKLTQDVLKSIYTEAILGNVPGSITRIYDSSAVVGTQGYTEGKHNGGGFSCDVTVTVAQPEGGQKYLANTVLPHLKGEGLARLSNDAEIEFGDGNKLLLSKTEYSTYGYQHHYAYEGNYTLTCYDCFGGESDEYYPADIKGGECVSCGIGIVMPLSTDAKISNIVFFDGTTKIGQAMKKNNAGDYVMDMDGEFGGLDDIKTVTIPKSVRYMSSLAFYNTHEIAKQFEINYGGTIAEFEAMIAYSLEQDQRFGYPWPRMAMKNTPVHCTDGDTILHGFQS